MTGHVSVIVLVTLTSSLILLTLLWRRKTKQDIAKRCTWKKVGYLEDIICYPIKSCGMLKLQDCDCTLVGPRKSYIGNRSFMLVDEAGQIITSKICPKIAGIKPLLNVGGITLTASSMDYSVFINVQKLLNEARLKLRLWNQEIQSLDCGDDAAKWLSEYVSDCLNVRLRLVFLPQKHLRQTQSHHPNYLLVTDESMKHLPYHFTPQHLRANFVIIQYRNNEQFSSDWIRIGSTIFKTVKSHQRLHPLIHQKSQTSRHIMETSVIYLDVNQPGSVAIGDFVYVNGN